MSNKTEIYAYLYKDEEYDIDCLTGNLSNKISWQMTATAKDNFDNTGYLYDDTDSRINNNLPTYMDELAESIFSINNPKIQALEKKAIIQTIISNDCPNLTIIWDNPQFNSMFE